MKKTLAVFLVFGTAIGILQAETGGWVKVNIPYIEMPRRGSSIRLNPFNPNEFYGYFKRGGQSCWQRTLDLGATWTRMGGNPDGYFFHPTIPNLVYKVEITSSWWQGVLLKSTDGGTTWGSPKPMPGTRPNDYWADLSAVGPLFIDPVNPGLLFWDADRIYRSADDGTTWTPLDVLGKERRDSAGNDVRPKALIYFDPGSPQTVFAVITPFASIKALTSNDADYVFKSTDNGRNWTSVYTWTNLQTTRAPGCFSQEPEHPLNMWVSAMWISALRSKDGGATWNQIDFNPALKYWAPAPSHRFLYDGYNNRIFIEIFFREKFALSQGFPAGFAEERYDPWCDFCATPSSNILFLISQNLTDPWQRTLYYLDLNRLNEPLRIALEATPVEERSWLIKRTLAKIRFTVSGRTEAGIAGESYFIIKKRVKGDGIFTERVIEVAGTNLSNDSYTYYDPIDANDIGVQYCVVAGKTVTSGTDFLKASPIAVFK